MMVLYTDTFITIHYIYLLDCCLDLAYNQMLDQIQQDLMLNQSIYNKFDR